MKGPEDFQGFGGLFFFPEM